MAAPCVHPSALIAPTAELADGVVVGPFAVVEDGVRVGPDAVVDLGAFLRRGTTVGAGARIGPYAVIGMSLIEISSRDDSGATKIAL